MNKRGISLVSISISIVIMLILVSVIGVSLTYSIANAKKMTFVQELYNIQSIVDEYIEKEGTIPEIVETLEVTPTDTTQFEGEVFNNGNINLDVLDLPSLDIKNTNYGNKSIGNNDTEKNKDVYTVSQTTGRVYYIAGFEINGKIYYTLTDELLKMVDKNQNLLIGENTIVFTPSKIGWGNEGIAVTVAIPSEFTSPSIQINNSNIQYTSSTSNNIRYYNVNTSKVAEEYTITVSYTKNGTAAAATYTAKIDTTAPEIIKSGEVANTSNEVKGLSATDSKSGIKYFKYAEGVIDISNVKAYMDSYGRKINNGSIKFETKTPYTIYAEDKAGNYRIAYIDVYGNITNNKPENVIVPAGFTPSIYSGENTVDGGFVIYETDSLNGIAQNTAMTTYNQFVWVPVDMSEFTRTAWKNNAPTSGLSSSYTEPYSYNTTITEANDLTGEYAEYKAMRASVEKYGGFYIGRYEAGSETERTNVANGTTKLKASVKDAYIYNYVGWGPSMTSASGDITYSSKNQGKGAVELSRNLYKDSTSVKSTLIYSVQWDAVLRFIADDKHNVNDSSIWGNHSNNPDRTSVSPNNPAKTGAHENWKAKNIYDLAGNVREWTMEAFSSDYRVPRGGNYSGTGSFNPASYRGNNSPSYCYSTSGFRLALYVV